MCSGAQSFELELIANRGNVALTCVAIRGLIEISKACEDLPWVNCLSHGYESVRSFSLKLPGCGDENASTPISRESLRMAWVHVIAETSLCQCPGPKHCSPCSCAIQLKKMEDYISALVAHRYLQHVDVAHDGQIYTVSGGVHMI